MSMHYAAWIHRLGVMLLLGHMMSLVAVRCFAHNQVLFITMPKVNADSWDASGCLLKGCQ